MRHPELLGEEDRQLVERYRSAADREAFAELWRRYEPRIRGSCRRVLRDDAAAEDITQDTFLRALVHLERLEPHNFGGWLCRIAHNLCINHLRSAEIRKRNPLGEAEVAEPVNGGGRENGIAEALIALMDTLSERQRIVLKMFYLEGCSYAEIIRATGFSEKEVRSAIQNGRRMLRSKWKRMRDGPE